MRPIAILTAIVLAAICTAPALPGQTILTFDITGQSHCSPMPPDYGDNVSAPTNGSYSYGGVAFTPNVVVDYARVLAGTGTVNDLDWYAGGKAGNCSPGCTDLTITLTAGSGFQVDLLGFDLKSGFGAPIIISEVRVANPVTGFVHLLQGNVSIQPPGFGGTTSFAFQAPLSAPSLEIRLTVPPGGNQLEFTSLDNVHFDQSPLGVVHQANGAQASLMVNGSGAFGIPGPFTVTVPPGGTLDMLWGGPAQAPLLLAVGPVSANGLFVGGAGVLHLGTAPLYNDVEVVFNGLLPTFPHFLFKLDATGIAQQTLTVPGPPVTLGMQGLVVQPGGNLLLTAAFDVMLN